jgi:hypothetical protein
MDSLIYVPQFPRFPKCPETGTAVFPAIPASPIGRWERNGGKRWGLL